jgi:2-oxoisovalerate dehydrogenase E1 component
MCTRPSTSRRCCRCRSCSSSRTTTTPTRRRMSEQFAAGTELWRRAAAYGIEGFALDATGDVEACTRTLAAAIDRVRATSRPMLIEAHTLRLRGHAAYDTCDYLKPGESEALSRARPAAALSRQARRAGHGARLDALDAELARFVEAVHQSRPRDPATDPTGLEADVLPRLGPAAVEAGTGHPDLTQPRPGDQRSASARSSPSGRVVVLGQDIGTYGGAFKVTDGLLKQTSAAAGSSTPRSPKAPAPATRSGSPSTATGRSRSFSSRISPPRPSRRSRSTRHDALPLRRRVSARAALSLRRRPHLRLVPLAGARVALPLDAGPQGALPSTPQDAFNALLAAYEDNNPVILFEHKALYRRGRGAGGLGSQLPRRLAPRQLRVRAISRPSSPTARWSTWPSEACDYLASEYETTFDLFDLRALAPLQLDAIKASLARTGRLIVLHEGRRTHGFGAELVARLTEEHFASLKSAPLRIACARPAGPVRPRARAGVPSDQGQGHRPDLRVDGLSYFLFLILRLFEYSILRPAVHAPPKIRNRKSKISRCRRGRPSGFSPWMSTAS